MKYKTGDGRGAANSKHTKSQLLEGTIANQSRTVSVLSSLRWVLRGCVAWEHTDTAAETSSWQVKQGH